jgi:geranylgeranyl transferase type-2 subunit alpha
VKDEFGFTTKKIEENFSNYSAWHQRSKLLPELYPDTETFKKALNDGIYIIIIGSADDRSEFELLQNAFYTEPSDQSIWFYHLWLLEKDILSSIRYILSHLNHFYFVKSLQVKNNVTSSKEN